MSIIRTSALALSVAIPAMALTAPTSAQNVVTVPAQTGATKVETVPAVTPPLAGESGPVEAGPSIDTSTLTPTFTETTSIGPDGVETITRTRFIRRPVTGARPVQPGMGGMTYPVMPANAVLGREQWLAECDRRIDGRSEKDRATIIGGLLGAVGGGILGNVLSDGNRLGGTLLGAGGGAVSGGLLGRLFGGGKKGGRYDCEAALDGYVDYYGQAGAIRTIPYPYPPSGYGYARTGNYGYSAGCGCQQPQMVLVPIQTQVRQRVIVRQVSEEKLIPGERVIPAPQPKPVKPSRPSKLIKK